MRNTLILLLFGCFVAQTISRPLTAEDARDNEGDQADYEGAAGEVAENEDSLQEDNVRLEKEPVLDNDEEDPGQTQHLGQSSGNTYSQQNGAGDDEPARDSEANFPGYKSNKNSEHVDEPLEDPNSNSEYQPSKQHDNNRYIERNDVNEPQDTVQRLLRRDENNGPRNENNAINHRALISSRTASNEEGDSLFENNESNREQQENSDKREYNNDAPNGNEPSQLPKKYYNTMQEDVSDGKKYESHDNFNRDRRALQETCNDTFSEMSSNKNDELEHGAPENEEAAIKKHVRKLSGEELEELLNSLSADKRELLKKIMESDVGNLNEINKREITKKAGAAPDDNSFLEGGQSEASKLQEGSAVGDSSIQTTSTETTETNKQPSPQELSVLPVTKTLEEGNSSATANIDTKSDLIAEVKSDTVNTLASKTDSNNQAIAEINQHNPTKTENKRETNSNDLSNVENLDDSTLMDNSEFNFKDLSNEPGYFNSQDEDLSQFIDDESQLTASNSNMFKREAALARDAELSESMKSLEESFPNSNAYDDDDPYSGSEMAPLVRVKRKNTDLAVKKRAAGILPDAKVCYVPYRAENDDEDNDEGNEFDDEGFYDRTSNLAKSVVKDQPSEEEISNNFDDSSRQSKNINKKSQTSLITRSKLTQSNKLASDTMSLGTDTDSVLSGVEGIDDNLMFNSGTRNRRAAGEASKDEPTFENSELKANNRSMRSTPFNIDSKSISDNYIAPPNYHENDAFGPLPRNYEGELGRYKRIRRVKQPSSSQSIAPSTN